MPMDRMMGQTLAFTLPFLSVFIPESTPLGVLCIWASTSTRHFTEKIVIR